MLSSIVFASTNAGKYRELSERAKLFNLSLVNSKELEGRYGPAPEVAETADTYLGNAKLKAQAYFEWCGQPVLADDSGLEVHALGGEPGLYSARYAGEGCSFSDNIKKLLTNLAGISERGAIFRATLVLIQDSWRIMQAEGELVGSIAYEPVGTYGFGYDPIFIVAGQGGLSLAQVKEREPDFPTHRIIAADKLFSSIR